MQNDGAAAFLADQALGTIKANFSIYFADKNSPLKWGGGSYQRCDP
jgi:hypothetical protein